MPNTPIDLVLLQTFHEVAQAGSVTAAAGALGRSQPAISHRLRALEAELGVPLFEKVGRRLRPSEYGRRLMSETAELMLLTRRIRASVSPAGDVEGQVAVGTLPALAACLLVEPMAQLLNTHPRVRLSFIFELVPRLLARLKQGELDLCVIVSDRPPPRFDVDDLGDAGLSAIMAPGLAPRRRGAVSPSELRRMRYLAWRGPSDPTFDRVERYADGQRLTDAHTPDVPHIETLRELAAAGAGYTILPTYTVRRDLARGRLVALRPRGLESSLRIYRLGRPSQVRTPALEAVRRSLQPSPTWNGRPVGARSSPRPGRPVPR